MNYQNFSLLFGFSVWLLATLAFRYWGHLFFLISNYLLLLGFFVATIPVLYLLAKWVFEKYQLDGSERLQSAVLMTVPGMLCDVACLQFHELVFPQLTIEQAVSLGAWIIWAYVIVLLLGFSNRQMVKMA